VSLNSNPNVKNPDIKDRESEEQMYLIDAGSGEILMHSKTMFYDGMQSPRMESPMGSPKHRGFLPDFNFMMLMHPDRWSR
ncbi:MAG: hypothetical protein NT001_04130, partial [Candidatus Woesearchaeota archaeon]|nr:hypothetical protein [Candidatus Woesearchaeota archaeon]